MARNNKKLKKQGKTRKNLPETRHYLWLAAIIILTIIVFAPSFQNRITNFDDIVYISENPYVQKISAGNLIHIFSESYYGGYYPLTLVSFAIDLAIGGEDPTRMLHFTNLFLHLLTVLLVFYFVFLLLKNFNIALIASALFAVHSMHVESVAWISERKDVLYAFFFMLSLIAYLKYSRKPGKKAYIWALIFFLLSILSKTMAASLALSLVLIDYFEGRKLLSKQVVLEKLPFFIIAIIFGVISILSQKNIGIISEENSLGFAEKIFYAGYAFTAYIAKLIFPYQLSAYYPYPGSAGLIHWIYFLISLALLFFMIYLWVKKKKALAFGLWFYALNIVLVLQFIQINNFVIADRFTYIASLGVFIFFAWAISRLADRFITSKQLIFGVFAAYILMLSFISNNRIDDWKDSVSIWNDVLDKHPGVHKAWNSRGQAKADELGNFQAAIRDYDRAIELKPDFYQAYINRGNTYLNLGQFHEALQDFNKAIEIHPDHHMAYNNRGNVKASSGRYADAIADFTKALELNPEYAMAHNNRGLAKANSGDESGALEDFNKAIEISPDYYAPYNYRGLTYARKQQYEKALEDFNKCIEIQPRFPDAYYNRAVVYLQLNQRNNACQDLSKAAELGNQRAYGMMQQYCR